mgnify:FL=1
MVVKFKTHLSYLDDSEDNKGEVLGDLGTSGFSNYKIQSEILVASTLKSQGKEVNKLHYKSVSLTDTGLTWTIAKGSDIESVVTKKVQADI